MKKKIAKQLFRVYGARSMKGSKLHVTLNKSLISTDIEEARKLLYDKYFSSGDIKITDLALTFCTETYYEPEDRKRESN
jgi:hypothetical protein